MPECPSSEETSPTHGGFSSPPTGQTAAAPPHLAPSRPVALADGASEEPFERVLRIAARALRVPTVLVMLVEADRLVFKHAVGLPAAAAAAGERPLSGSFSRRVAEAKAPLAIDDVRPHALGESNAAFQESGLVAYLGVPLLSPEGRALGALCAASDTPRAWSPEDLDTLTDLAAVLTDEFRLREMVRRLEEEERAHAANRALTEDSLDAITDLFFILDLDHRLIRWNRRMAPVTGYVKDDLTDMHAEQFFPEEDRPAIREAIARVYETGHATVEASLLTKDGRRLPYELNGSPLRDPDGRVIGLCGTARDITERKVSERALRGRELRFRSFIEATAQVVWRGDEDGNIVELSETWSVFTGQTQEELEGWGWANALHPEDAARVVEEWRGYLAQHEPYETQYRVRCHLGGYHWFSVRAVPVFDGDELVEWVGTCVDVEEEHRMEEALRLSEARHRSLIEANPDIFLRLSRDGRYLDVQAQDAENLLIAAPSELVGRTIPEFLPAPAATKWLTVIAAALDTRRLQRYEYELETLDGETHHFEARVVPVGAAEVQVIVRDITDRRRYELGLVRAIEAAEEARRQADEARRQAEEVARVKASLLTNMSHEIRTPLTSIIGFAEIIREEADEALGECARHIGASGRRLLDTLNSVLDLAQIEARRYPLRPVAFDLGLVACDTAELLRPQAGAKGVALRCLLPDEPVRISTDKDAFARVVMNLVSNAVKFTGAGSVTVAARALPSGDEAELRVEDTGVGIDAAFLPLLFDEFRQESEGEARDFEGSGLGLSITKRLVELMGGTIAAESRKGEGTTFTVRLPLTPPRPATVPPA